jgi:hypothetical protein
MNQQPKKGIDEWRHCYIGQELILLAELKKKNISLQQFNQIWDSIEQQNQDSQLSEDEKNPEYRQEIARRILRQIQNTATNLTEQPWKPFTPEQLIQIYRHVKK